MKLISVYCFWRVGADQDFIYAVLLWQVENQETNLFCQNLISLSVCVQLSYSFEHFHRTEMLCRS